MNMPILRARLGELQRAIKAARIPVMIVFEGLQASGKSRMVNELLQGMDPRCFRVHAIGTPSQEESLKPFMWRFWKMTPPAGRIDIFDESWYRGVFAKIADGRKKSPLTSRKALEILAYITSFERELAEDAGSEQAKPYLILKFFLDITKKEQKKRLEGLDKNKIYPYFIDKADWEAFKRYDEQKPIINKLIKLTNTEYAPWHVIEADDWNSATIRVYQIVNDALQERLDLDKRNPTDEGEKNVVRSVKKAGTPPILADIKTDIEMPQDEYERRMKACHEELARLQYKAYKKGLPVVIAFEGMDAAGKGGSIKRLTESLDPRGYEVIPIGVPTEWEKAQHYLWRFWIRFPPKGFITVFDRTWYGRVLVERVAGLTPEKYWRHAYDEINQMEKELADNGTVITKFWMHIDSNTEYQRFLARERTPDKNWKIGPNDWKDRSKWDQYMIAVDEMLACTNTRYAPWTIVPADDKHYARVMVMDTVIEAMRKAL